jgi:PAS domain S-box-containing protein
MLPHYPKHLLRALEQIHQALLEEPRVASATRRLLEVLVNSLGIERAALFLYNEEERELQGEMAYGRGEGYTVSALGFPIEGQGDVQRAFFAPPDGLKSKDAWLLPVLASGEKPCWADPEVRCRVFPRANKDSRHRLCPPCAHFGALGVLLLEGVPREAEPLVPLLGRLTALAVRNAALYEETLASKERLDWEVRFLDQAAAFSREIIHQTTVRGVARTLAETLAQVFAFYRITVALVQGKELRGILTLKGGQLYWTEHRTRIRFPIDANDPMAEAARTGRPLLVPLEKLPDFLRSDHSDMGLAPLVGYVPLVDREEVLGVVAVDRGPGGPGVTWEELVRVDFLGRVAGVALRNAQTHEALSHVSKELARERERLSQVLEDLPVGVVVLDTGTFSGIANHMAREALGVGREVVLDHLPREVYPALEGEKLNLELGGRTFQTAVRRQEGVWILSLTDISEIQHLLGELESRETFYRMLLENNQDVVYLLDASGIIRYVTPNVQAVLGYDPSGYLKEEVGALQYVFAEDRAKAEALFREALGEPGKTVTAELRVVNSKGEPRWFEAWARNLLHEPAVGGVVVTLHDLSARKEVERAKDEFIAAVSHELRTPLGVIIGLAEALQLSQLPETEKGHVNLILDSALRLKNMVDNLLDASRLEAGRFEVFRCPTDLAPVLDEVARSFHALAQLTRIDFHVEIPPAVPAVADHERIGQVVANLLSNAFKFTPKGGRVSLRVVQDQGWIHIEVTDTGPGIPEEEIPRLFQRYYRARSQASRGAPGTGLGLYISRAIVEAHGGEILVTSQPGKGATFLVRLPRAAGQGEAGHAGASGG